ncbi:SPOR domain-containing protein [Thermomonas sp.]|uniref:SPOR domain-containing protein n=1 Tax=Thermomonas sp. TaxID=1971895 RepID=UPI002487E4F9|nr:SPOR domain-containing protein [Thermomonas sp.]MDI1252455.1 SPOR domain-containing protein [Thermomonas sp.]
MAARRGKSQARRNPSGGLPGWAWLVIGVLVTLLVVLAAPRLLKSGAGGDGFLRIGPKPNPDAQPATSANDDDALAPDVTTDSTVGGKAGDSKPKPQYDFYTLLPGQEVEMSDAELAASAKAETAAQTAATQAGTSTVAGGLPKPIAENPDAAGLAASTNASSTTPNAGTTVATSSTTSPSAPTSDAHYILQAGAFGGSGDAETVKAKIALLGLNARVEAAEIRGKTVYRVRMGPYGTASELAAAKSKLTNGGLPAMAVKTN